MSQSIQAKSDIAELAVFGGPPLYATPISTSNLVRPEVRVFFDHARQSHAQGRWTDGGPIVRRLEQRLAAYHGTAHCISFVNGFWAIALAARCLALPGRSEVVMPSLTYRRLADIMAWVGLVPHFCEVDPATLAISAATAAPCINERTALLLGVHPIVNVCDAAGLEALAAAQGLPLLFDAVESVHETLGGRKVGSFGSAECFSLHASKLVNGFEGGYVTTQDDALANRLRRLRDGGRDADCADNLSDDGVDDLPPAGLGMHAALNEVHAALALAGLDELPDQIARNEARYRCYQRELAGLAGLRLLAFDEAEATSFKTIVVELDGDWPLSRDQTVDLLNREQILARSYYAPPLHRKTMRYPALPATLPLTDRLASRFMLLPCGHLVDEADIAAVAGLLRLISHQGPAIRARWKA